MLNFVMPNVVILSVDKLNVVAPYFLYGCYISSIYTRNHTVHNVNVSDNSDLTKMLKFVIKLCHQMILRLCVNKA
jgi:hypothetical protein